MTPPQVRGLVPRSPLGSSVLFSGTVLELTCDAYTKSEADGRYVQSGNLGSLDSRYFPVNGNNGGGGGIFPMVITTLTPRMIRAILPRAPLSGALILGNAGTLELNCDCYSTSESDSRYYTKGQSDTAYAPLTVQAEQQANTSAIGALDSRVTALEGSGGVPADISCTSLTASSFVNTLNFTATGNTTGVDALFTQDVQTPLLRPVSAVDNHVRIAAGLVSTRLVDDDGVTALAQFSGLEAHMQVPTRCDRRLTIDDVSGPAEGLFTNEISAKTGDNLLTINGGVNGVTVLGPGLAVAGTMRATTQVTTPSDHAERCGRGRVRSPQPGQRQRRHQDHRRRLQRAARGGKRRDAMPQQGAVGEPLGRRRRCRGGAEEHREHRSCAAAAGRQHGHGLRAA